LKEQGFLGTVHEGTRISTDGLGPTRIFAVCYAGAVVFVLMEQGFLGTVHEGTRIFTAVFGGISQKNKITKKK